MKRCVPLGLQAGLWALLLLFFLTSCRDIRLSGRVEGLEGDTLTLDLLQVSYTETIDTLITKPDGSFSCRVKPQGANPDFYYLNSKGKRLASLLLKGGDKVRLEADTRGHCRIEGSDESARMMASEKEFASMNAKCASLAARLEGIPADSKHAAQLRRELSSLYVSIYRSSVRYVVENNKSLTSVPVLYRKVGELPVFNQPLDGLHFRTLADSLSAVYPTSPYVRALRKEAQAREKALTFGSRLDSVSVVGFPDIELPDLSGKKVKLSSVEGKVVLLHFWTSEDGGQKLLNQDVLKPLYEKYHAKGLEIYQVALDPGKFSWAQVVKSQQMPWVNVCDIRASASPLVALYNLEALPTTYLIVDGELSALRPQTEAQLRKALEQYL